MRARLDLAAAGRRLAAALTVLAVACGGPPERQSERPDYAQSDYAAPAREPESFPAIGFTNVAESAGIDFVHETGAFGKKWMPETMGSGGAFLDYDGDGLPDLLLVNGSEWPGHRSDSARATARLYRNLGDGRFRDVTREAGLDISLYGMGATAADYDADGDVDVYLTAVGTNRLLRNDDGRFSDVTRVAGATGDSPEPGRPPAWSTAAAWVDVDRDGWLDLFVCNYVKWTPETDLYTTMDGETKSYATPEQYEGETCRLYGNRGDGTFEDVTRETGVHNPHGKSLGVEVADFNDDGWPDLVVANDMYRNFLYRNDGDGTFTDVGVQAGVAYDEFGRARAGMGIDVADVEGDGSLSIGIGNFSHESLGLFTQTGDGLFQDRAGRARVSGPSLLPLTFGLRFADVDRDGRTDLLVANGHIEPTIHSVQKEITFRQSPQLFLNRGDGRFVEATEHAGRAFSEPVVGRGLATSDYDRDGDLDVLLTVNGGQPKLLRNDLEAPERHWIRLRLRGERPNTGAVGAEVVLWAGELSRRERVTTAGSYLSQSEANPLLLGLGPRTQVDSLRVTWPTDGHTVRYGPLETDRSYLVAEGDGTIRRYQAPYRPGPGGTLGTGGDEGRRP